MTSFGYLLRNNLTRLEQPYYFPMLIELVEQALDLDEHQTLDGSSGSVADFRRYINIGMTRAKATETATGRTVP